jgi:hypothetical protein
MEAAIKTIFLFKNQAIAAGSYGLSDPIPLRDHAREGHISLSYTTAPAGGVGTAGTATFSVMGCAVYDGTYVTPTGGTCGTAAGTAGGSDIVSLNSQPVMPFMKIKAAIGTSGTALVTAALHVR